MFSSCPELKSIKLQTERPHPPLYRIKVWNEKSKMATKTGTTENKHVRRQDVVDDGLQADA